MKIIKYYSILIAIFISTFSVTAKADIIKLPYTPQSIKISKDSTFAMIAFGDDIPEGEKLNSGRIGLFDLTQNRLLMLKTKDKVSHVYDNNFNLVDTYPPCSYYFRKEEAQLYFVRHMDKAKNIIQLQNKLICSVDNNLYIE